MCGSEKNSQNKYAHYQIKVQGKLNVSWSDWFGGMTITTVKEADSLEFTILDGVFLDQAALRGVLIKIWDLNATLIEVKQINPRIGNPMEVKK